MTTPKPDYLVRAELAMIAAFDRYDGPAPGDAKKRSIKQWIADGEAALRANPGNLKAKRQLEDLQVWQVKANQACADAILAFDAAWERAGGVQWPYEPATLAYMAREATTEEAAA